LEIDINGAKNISKELTANYIAIIPPSLEELEVRLRGRGTEKEEDIKNRVEIAGVEIEEIKISPLFTSKTIIVNDNLSESKKILRVLVTEKYPTLL
jgi:guanylate kinase